MPTKSQFIEAVGRVLRGSSVPPSTQRQIADHIFSNHGMGHRQLVFGLKSILATEDFSWPWFDEWHARFTHSKKWPQHPPGWSWFEASAAMPTAPDAVRAMFKPDLVALASLKKIDGPAKLKVTELRALLIEKVRRSDVGPMLEVLAEKSQAAITAKRADAKWMLLIASIETSALMLFRFDQVCDLISCTSGRRVSLDTGTSDPVAKKLAKSWVFDPRSTENLPPFFPGDCTGIHAPR